MELRIVENDRENTTLPLSIMLHDDKMYRMEKTISNIFMRLFNAISYCFWFLLSSQNNSLVFSAIKLPVKLNHRFYSFTEDVQ